MTGQYTPQPGDLVRRIEPKRTLEEDIEANQRELWDWADYEALWMLAKQHEINGAPANTCVNEYGLKILGAVARALDEVWFCRPEDEQWRAQVAERIRRIAG